MSSNNNMIPLRQGDVLLMLVDALPANVREEPRDEHGHVVLALGEHSGHRHAIRDRNVLSFRVESAERDALSADVDFILVGGSTTKEDQLARRVAVLSVVAEVSMTPEFDETPELRECRRQFVAGALSADPDGILVNHEYVSGVRADHFPIIAEPGIHKVVGQRTYSPKAIIRAVD